VPVVSNKDYREILDLLYSVNQCQDLDGLSGTLCRSMIQTFHSECVTFHLIEGLPWRINVVESRSFKSDFHDLVEDKHYPALYQDGLFQSSPLLKAALSSSKPVLKIGSTISTKEWESSAFYQNLISSQHLYWELFLPIRWKDNMEGMITMWRSPKHTDYEPADIARAEILAPHLTLAIHNISTISKINGWSKKFSENETNRDGLLLLDQHFRPVYSNAKAREICLYLYNRMPAETVNIEHGDFPVPAGIIKDCSDLLDTIKTESQFISWPKERSIYAESCKQFRSECSLVWKAYKTSSVPNFMVTLTDVSGKNRLENDLQTKFHLSRREIDIIYCIVSDMSYGETADKLFISKLTVHTHVKNIYRKLGVRNKIELYRRIQSLNWMM
jgi:DNA-binding CsgD family transcriptional regulator